MPKTQEFINDLKLHGRDERSWGEIANLYGYANGESARTAWKNYKVVNKIREKQEVVGYVTALEDRVLSLEEDLKNNKAQLTYRSKEEIRTLDELVIKTNIDLNKWKIVRWRQNYWGNINDPHWQVRAELEPRKLDKDPELQKEYLLEQIKKYQKESSYFHKLFKAQDKHFGSDALVEAILGPNEYLLEISIPDLHIGKLAWGLESGEDYDITIAVDRYKTAVTTLLNRVPKDAIARIVLPVGNDLIHIDNAENQTTSGTPVDTDSRFAKIVQVAKKLLIETIDELKQIAPVDVIIVRGNHDSTVTFLLGEVIEAWFHTDPLVTVDNGPQWRKYYQYGKVGVQLTHGEKEKHDELGLIFATEQPQLWANTKYRFCKLGHFHKTKKVNYVTVDSNPGFQIEVLPSLSGTDEWHSGKGYLSNKQAKAFLYHKEEGEIAEYTYTV